MSGNAVKTDNPIQDYSKYHRRQDTEEAIGLVFQLTRLIAKYNGDVPEDLFFALVGLRDQIHALKFQRTYKTL